MCSPAVALTARNPQMQLACVRARNWLRRRLMAQPIYIAYINATTRAFFAEGLRFSGFRKLLKFANLGFRPTQVAFRFLVRALSRCGRAGCTM